MISNLLRNLVAALLLHAVATLAFGGHDAPVVTAGEPQACMLPVADAHESTSTLTDTGARS